jgi:uncharacterized Rmd1/YagE family protein
MLSTFNSKLRRRNSAGAPLTSPRLPGPGPKLGPQRTTKKTQKLTLLPNPEPEEEPDEESGRDVYSQFTRIKDPTARRDAARLGKADRERLPRVTAYCTASAYKLDGMIKYIKGKAKQRGTAPKQFDECIYTPWDYNFGRPKDRRSSTTPGDAHDELGLRRGPPSALLQNRERRRSDSALEVEEHTQARREDLMDLAAGTSSMTIPEDGESSHAHQVLGRMPSDDLDPPNPDLDIEVHMPEVFLFDYGTVVIWGMTLAQEKRFLKEIAKFESEKLAPDDVETEEFNFYYTRDYQARIYNDFISLRDKRNYMTKLAISHALAQSVKVSPYDTLVSHSIPLTNPRPPSSKTSSARQSPTRRHYPVYSPTPAESPYPAAQSTRRSASCLSCVSTSTYKARCWTRRSSCGPSQRWSPSMPPCAATWKWTSAWS